MLFFFSMFYIDSIQNVSNVSIPNKTPSFLMVTVHEFEGQSQRVRKKVSEWDLTTWKHDSPMKSHAEQIFIKQWMLFNGFCTASEANLVQIGAHVECVCVSACSEFC